MKLIRKVGASSQIFQIFISDSSSTVGAGRTALAYNSASLTSYYHRDTNTTAIPISLIDMTVGAYTASGFKEIDTTNMPGWYQFCPPDACFASGASSVGFHLKGASNMAPLPIEVDLASQVDVTSLNGSTTALANLSNVYAAMESGQAQGGGTNTITLRSAAVATDNYYKDQVVFILSGNGVGQTNRITSYVGSTRVATVETTWTVQPNSGSIYLIVGRVG